MTRRKFSDMAKGQMYLDNHGHLCLKVSVGLFAENAFGSLVLRYAGGNLSCLEMVHKETEIGPLELVEDEEQFLHLFP